MSEAAARNPPLTVIVPSRGRPENLRRLAHAVAATASSGTRVLTRIDFDDSRRSGYLRDMPDNVHVTIGQRSRFVASVNELAGKVTTPYIAVLGDDVLPETAGWDTILIDSLRGELGVAYGSDGLEHKHGPDLPTHVVLPTEIYTRLGWVAMPRLRHLFVDNVWRELGAGLDNFVYSPHVKLTHLHPWAGKATRDKTYAEANEPEHRERDRAAFETWRDSNVDGLAHALARLRAVG